MIKKLHIRDFRNITEITIEPSSHVNLISGNNGEGKSSILYAIEYLLTDNLNEKMSEYVRKGQEKFYLEMEFIHDSDNYFIKVEGGKSAKKELIVNGELNYKNSEATKKLAEIINPNIVRYSSISEQGKTAQILFDTPANRLKKLKEILGIDKIADLCDEIKIDTDKKQEEINSYDKEIRLLEERTYNFLDVIDLPDIEKVKNQFQLLELEKKNYELQNTIWLTYQKELSDYTSACRKREISEAEILGFKESIEELQSKTKEVVVTESVEDLSLQLSKIEKEELSNKNNKLNYNRVQNKITELENTVVQKNSELESYPLRRLCTCKYTDEEVIECEKNLNENKVDLVQFEKELKLAESGKCPTCGKDFIVDIESLKTEIKDCKSEIAHFTNCLVEYKKEIQDYKDRVNEQELTKVRRQNIEQMLDNSTKEIEKLKNELSLIVLSDNDYDSIIIDLQNKIKTQKEIADFNLSLNNKINDLNNKIQVSTKLKEQYDNVVEPVKVEESIQYDEEEYSRLNKEIIIYDQKVKEKERIESHNEKIVKEKLADLERIKTLMSLIDSLSYEVSILKESRQVLDKEFSAWLIDQGAEYLKEKMNQFFQQVSNKYAITFSQDKNSIDFFYGDDKGVSPCSMASGMEKAILAISFRVALCSLNNLDLMILDEIDSEFSEENSLKLYETLIESMKDYQIFCITHVEDTKEYIMQSEKSKQFLVKNGQVN